MMTVDQAERIFALHAPYTEDDVLFAYKRLCKVYHPDSVVASGGNAKAATEMMQDINAAKDVLMENACTGGDDAVPGGSADPDRKEHSVVDLEELINGIKADHETRERRARQREEEERRRSQVISNRYGRNADRLEESAGKLSAAMPKIPRANKEKAKLSLQYLHVQAHVFRQMRDIFANGYRPTLELLVENVFGKAEAEHRFLRMARASTPITPYYSKTAEKVPCPAIRDVMSTAVRKTALSFGMDDTAYKELESMFDEAVGYAEGKEGGTLGGKLKRLLR